MVWFFFLIPVAPFNDPFATVIESSEGELLGASISADGQWRFPPADSVPDKFATCLLAFEDRYFYYHPGFNPVSLFRALMLNIRQGAVVSGGSTLTMQVVRLSRKNRPRTYPEKIIEIFYSLRLELAWSKDKILALYASHAPFGGNIVGLDAASWKYYQQSPFQLSWAESATLAVLPNAPGLIHPGKNRQILMKKRNRLLKTLFVRGAIDSLTYELARAEPLPKKPEPLPQIAPHVLVKLQKEHTGERIRTSLVKPLQEQSNRLVDKHYQMLRHNNIHNLAMMVVAVKTGNVLAYTANAVSAGPEHDHHVDLIQAPRSTGSIMKPLLYAAMLDDGLLLPTTLIPDIPTRISGYQPENFSSVYAGAVPAEQALYQSLNIPAVRMLQQYGVERFYELLQRLGISTLNHPSSHYGLSLILGGAEATLWDLASVYATMGRLLKTYNEHNGKYLPADIHPLVLKESDTPLGNLPGFTYHNPYPLTVASIWKTYQALQKVNRPENQTGWQYFSNAQRIAWKTGTSFGFRDAWAIGTTPDYLVAVWAGNADGEGRPGLTGTKAAAPLMFDMFTFLPANQQFSPPLDEMRPHVVCQESGYPASPICPQPDTLWSPGVPLRIAPCPYHTMVHLNQEQTFRVTDQCYSPEQMVHIPWFVLPPVMEWYYTKIHPEYQPLPVLLPGCQPLEAIVPMQILQPKDLRRVYVPRNLDGSRSEIIFEIAHRTPECALYWHLNGVYLQETRHMHQLGILPPMGDNHLKVVDEFGNELQIDFEAIDRE